MGQITGNGTAVTGLGGAAGYGETALARGDDTVAKVDVSAVFGAGFTLGSTHYAADQLYISTDGVVSFGAGYSGVAPDAAAIPAPFFALFNADVDTRLDGEGAESGPVWLDVDTVNDCVTITWDHVGFYRRNASQADTFQMQIFDRGGGSFDVVYRYQSIHWTAGDLQGGFGGNGGTAATIGYRIAASGAVTELAASGDQTAQLGLAGALGNTGVAGLFVFSFAAASVIDGGDTADILQGTARNDTVHAFGGSDVIMGSAGADLIDGGTGTDRVDFSAAPGSVRLDLTTPSLNTGYAAGDIYIGVEAFTGSDFGDTLAGSAAANTFYGGTVGDDLQGRDGNDALYGGTGGDHLDGGTGNDLLNGGDGNDLLVGGSGDDTLSGITGDDTLQGKYGRDLLHGGDGQDVLIGGAGRDTILGGDTAADGADILQGRGGHDALYAGAGDDVVKGGARKDVIKGGDGADRLFGQDGDDFVFGGRAGDRMLGGAGRDRLDGGKGTDTVSGGLGADHFVNAGTDGQGHDLILDFSNADHDALYFGIDRATAADFRVEFVTIAGAGRPGVAEAKIIYLPTGTLIWTLVDGAGQDAIMVHSSMNSFDVL